MTRRARTLTRARGLRGLAPLIVVSVLLAIVPGALVTQAAAAAGPAPVSDDFSGGLDASRWYVVDPLGDASVSTVGAGTQDAQLVISVPGGVSHNAWGTNNAPRVMQSVTNGDFGMEVKFDSLPSKKYQDQGLLVEQDAGRWLRFSVYSDGAGRFVFAASTTDGKSTQRLKTSVSVSAPPVWMRVVRTGSTWELLWSADGVAWTSAGSFDDVLTVAAVGVYAGNSGSTSDNAPGFESRVDYLFDMASPILLEDGGDTTPPVISGVSVSAKAESAVVSWSTDEPTTGRVEFGLSEAYGAVVESATAAKSHSVTLTGLDPTTTYHYRIVVADAAGNGSATGDATFRTPTVAVGPAPVSDDFSGGLDASRWYVVDPLGDASVSTVGAGTQDAQLVISVPGGVSHNAWGTNNAPRVMQSVTNGDFGMEVKFDSLPSKKYQDQGLLVEQDAGRWLRFSVYSDGAGRFVFAASTTDGKSTQRLKTSVSVSAPPVWLRVVRTGSTWELLWAADGVAWTSAGSFDEVLEVSAVGVYAGNSGGSPPAFASRVDYLFDMANPIADDPDTVPPVIEDITLLPGSAAADVAWRTNEATTATVEYGTTSHYGSSVAATSATEHKVKLTGLSASTLYHYRIVVQDPAGNTTASPDLTFTTTPPEGPAIDAWNGPRQVFGRNGLPQPWANVVGNIRDGDGLDSLTYSLNGASPKSMGLGPDTRRLQDHGDFNADIATSSLVLGDNQVVFTAKDSLGHVSTATVVVELEAGAAPALPYELSWQADVPLLEQAQVVDGLWSASTGSVANALYGYDRVVALGSRDWTDYEVTVPVTVHSIGPASGSVNSGPALVGLGLRWQGHKAEDKTQPAWGYKKAGSYVWHRWYSTPKLEAVGYGASPKAGFVENMDLGRQYMFKTRISTSAGTTTLRSRTWPVGTPEPTTWEVSIDETDTPGQGSIVLIAHQLKATFGVVTVAATSP
jgi:regulation of enolase protein 1 (concanavalin A-like superfamily)